MPQILLCHFDNSFVAASERHTVVPVGNAHISTVRKKFNRASARFDGASDYLTVDGRGDFVFNTGDFTVDFWMFPDGNVAQDYTDVLDFGFYETPPNWNLYTMLDGSLVFDAAEGVTQIVSATGIIIDEAEIHVAVTRASGTTRLFMNGAVAGSIADTNAYVTPNSSWPLICSGGNGNFFKGWIDELHVDNTEALWNSAFVPPSIPYSPTDEILASARTA